MILPSICGKKDPPAAIANRMININVIIGIHGGDDAPNVPAVIELLLNSGNILRI
jgi:hypothetical protein